MIPIIGIVVGFGCVLAGFILSGGHPMAIFQPYEVLTIGGAALGGLIVMSSKKVLVDLFKGMLGAFKESPYNKAMHIELFKLSYDLLRVARRDGLLGLDRHLNDPHQSELFNKYPRIAKDHHVVEFLCGGLSPLVDGSVTAESLPELLESELKVMEEEHHAVVDALSKTAEALPGFGIVAAVLGIVITMGSISGPVEEIGHHVGAALVGTFMGVLLSYGLFGPLAARMDALGHKHVAFFKTIATIVQTFACEVSPKVAIEQARRGIGTDVRPDRAGMEELFKQVEAA